MYAEIAGKYLDVARSYDALADAAWRHDDDEEEFHCRTHANRARQCAEHYSRLSRNVNDQEAREEDEHHP